MSHNELEEYILSLENTWLDFPFGQEVSVYKIGHKDSENKSAGKMFALIAEGSNPLRVSLKCDPKLALHLREKYESVLPGYHLNKKHWNTIICSGQLSESEIKDLIRHSYELVVANLSF
ncbi:MmcQ/YjbR family DNA-binding protein [Candidatus Saccharibacteria bacterium]|jgi:predicted DNA-binding protein (MmcQ/YjbR family)|nr:MmcQ/YjbR family DNA-binding protein [Candidatus Saccharibacteria bacterium]